MELTCKEETGKEKKHDQIRMECPVYLKKKKKKSADNGIFSLNWNFFFLNIGPNTVSQNLGSWFSIMALFSD